MLPEAEGRRPGSGTCFIAFQAYCLGGGLTVGAPSHAAQSGSPPTVSLGRCAMLTVFGRRQARTQSEERAVEVQWNVMALNSPLADSKRANKQNKQPLVGNSGCAYLWLWIITCASLLLVTGRD